KSVVGGGVVEVGGAGAGAKQTGGVIGGAGGSGGLAGPCADIQRPERPGGEGVPNSPAAADGPAVRDRERARAVAADFDVSVVGGQKSGARAGHRHSALRAGIIADDAEAENAAHGPAALDRKRARAVLADEDDLGCRA